MSELENSDLLKRVLKALYTAAARRTTHNFAVVVIDTIIKTLEQRYDFLKHVRINSEGDSEDFVDIGSDINSVLPAKIGKAIEDIVQVVFMDLKEKAGQYFIKEIEGNAREEVISKLRECGVDLELFMPHQHYLYRRQQREKKTKNDVKGETEKQSMDNVGVMG